MREKYYAIQIGRRPQHRPYFMLGPDGKTPALFIDRKTAAINHPRTASTKIVRVFVTTL